MFAPHADPSGDCVLKRLLASQPSRRDLSFPQGFEAGIAHRLDISTSGALVVADDPDELASIREAFKSGALRKTYRLRAARSVPWDRNRCDRPIAHDRRRKKRMVVKRGENTPHRGKWLPAETAFRRIGGDLFEAEMRSGVMHQIRVHAAFLGIPLLGDSLYGGGQPPADAPEGLRYFLHHQGLVGPDLQTAEVPLPAWAAGE